MQALQLLERDDAEAIINWANRDGYGAIYHHTSTGIPYIMVSTIEGSKEMCYTDWIVQISGEFLVWSDTVMDLICRVETPPVQREHTPGGIPVVEGQLALREDGTIRMLGDG